ncbi:MAG: A/G-specific adenine glycosylase [Sphingobium sp.]
MPVESIASLPASQCVSDALLRHYDAHARRLPWRVPPGAPQRPDPYRVWLSEIMLQQTTVAAVIPYFAKFTTRWPDVTALARADEAEVMAAWAGLGYYARARNLIACARVVADRPGGRFPDEEEGLRALPGVGAYTAAAIAAIAFGRRAVVVDANVERVVARLFAIETPLPQARSAIREATDRITPDSRAGDFAQAMMDLGSAICTVKAPQCLLCPLRPDCAAHAQGRAEAFPVKPPKKEKPTREGVIWWLEREDGHVWIERRDDRRMLGGMAGLPGSAWDARGGAKAGEPPVRGDWLALNGGVEHVFTHFRLLLSIRRLDVARDCMPDGEGRWWPLDAMGEAGFPTLFAKVVDRMTKKDDDAR